MIRTLRARLSLWHLGVLALTLALFAAMLYALLANSLQHHHDDELALQATSVVALMRGRPIADGTVMEALASAGVSSRFVMVRGPDGQLYFREPALQATEPNIGRHAALTHAAMTRPSAPEFFTVHLDHSGAVRFICVPMAQADRFLQIGDPIGDVREALDSLRRASLVLFPVVLLVSGVGSWILTRRALQPLRAIGETLTAITASDLSRRVDVEPADLELSTLIKAQNQLLDRLQRAFEDRQQFAGDVSHQLQTPLTVMKSGIEAARDSTKPDGSEVFLAEMDHQIDAMSATIAALQSLSTADAPVAWASVDLLDVVRESAEIIAALGEMKGVVVSTLVEPLVRTSTRGDPIRLRQVFLNLGENAVKFTAAGGSVEIRLTSDGESSIVEMRDSGVGIAFDDQPRVFDRLFHTGAPLGTGLGLAIARKIVEAHGGTIAVTSEPGRGSTFTVRLPR